MERRTVNRPVTAADEALFAERTIEATETSEEAVVAKEARVVEELVVRKDAEERVQTVQDTVRRTEVEIEDDRTDRAAGTARRPALPPGRRARPAPTGAEAPSPARRLHSLGRRRTGRGLRIAALLPLLSGAPRLVRTARPERGASDRRNSPKSGAV